jgi:hypothetical protein
MLGATLNRNVTSSGNIQTNDHYPNGLSGLIPGTAISAQNIVPGNGASNPSVVATQVTLQSGIHRTKNLVDTTQQSATLLSSTRAAGADGNFYPPDQDAQGNIIQNQTYQGQDKGYSQLGE